VSRESRNVQVADARLAPQESRLADTLLFTRKLLVKGRQIAAINPSGAAISRTMARQVDFSQPGVIVELGAGTGAITKAIIENLQPHHRLILVEIDPDFVEILRQRFPQYTVIKGDATRMAEPLANLGVKQVKYVFSGLATPSLPVRGQERLHHWMRQMLDPGATFAQITFIPQHAPWRHVYQRYYARLFHEVHFTPVWRNVPPGGVFCCRHIRDRIAPKARRKRLSA
jgi:phospholipid N-methyltransferase